VKPQRPSDNCRGSGEPIISEINAQINPASPEKFVMGPHSPVSAPCAYILTKIANETSNALIDCGSSLSFIDASLKDDLVQSVFKYTEKDMPVKVEDKRWVLAKGYILAVFKIRNRTFKYPLVLLENTLQPIILGVDFIKFSGICLNFHDNLWWWLDKPNHHYRLDRNPNLDPLFCGQIAHSGKLDQYSYSKLDIDEKVDAIKILNTEQKEQLRALLYAYLHVFSKRPGRFKGFRMEIGRAHV